MRSLPSKFAPRKVFALATFLLATSWPTTVFINHQKKLIIFVHKLGLKEKERI